MNIMSKKKKSFNEVQKEFWEETDIDDTLNFLVGKKPRR